jgi:RNA-directed DNA polymerase
MNVPEESDSGVLPMNHSNKIEQSMAESEEGRPLIKENIHQSSTRPTQSGARARVTGAGGCAESSKGTQGDEVHRTAPPCHG